MTRVASSYQPEARAESINTDSLWDFVPAVTPTFTAPRHLHPIADGLEQARLAAAGEAEPVFLCTSIPPQHGKSETYLHGIAHWLSRQPSDFLAYLSYNQDQADAKSSKVRDYARIAGVDIRQDTHSKRLWRTMAGGGLMAGGIVGGSVTGKEALRALVIDDPFRNRADAESRVIRDKVWAEFRSSIWTRLHEGTSVFVNHTRWHPDDLIGRIKKDGELSRLFRFVNLPAVRGCDPLEGDDYEVLWPEGQSKELIRRKRAGASAYEWWSLYMGEPRPRDTQLFRDVFGYWTDYPSHARIAIGVDLAYTAKTSSDWSVAVVMAESAERFYVVDVIRRQCSATDFASSLHALAAQYPGTPMRAYIGGTERGTTDFFAREGIPIVARPATTDKFLRAQPLSAAWNQGRVLIPQSPEPWRDAFVGCLLDFTGNNDPQDDDVDAAAAAYDALAAGESGVYLPHHDPDRNRRARPARRLAPRGRKQGAW